MSDERIQKKIAEIYCDNPQQHRAMLAHISENAGRQAPLKPLLNNDRAFRSFLQKMEAEAFRFTHNTLDENQIVPANHANSWAPGAQLVAAGAGAGAGVVQMRFQGRSGAPLVAVTLGFEAVMQIRSWWKGEITGVRCAKNLVDSMGAVAGGVAGGEVGSRIGQAVTGGHWLGAAVGALAGGVLGSSAGGALADRLTQELFGLPKSEALEKAYAYLEVRHTATNEEINTSYRQLAKKYHPDKGGSEEDFHKLQYSLEIVRNARE